MEAHHIDWLHLAAGGVLLLAPLGLLIYFRTGLGWSALIACGRMVIQLILVGLYLKFIFAASSVLLNLVWVGLMAAVAGVSIARRASVRLKTFFAPLALSMLAGVAVTEAVLFAVVIQAPEPLSESRYVIPITGMILGNCLQAGIIAVRSCYHGLLEHVDEYRYLLAAGASRNEALAPFIREALRAAFQPVIGTIATIGLIALPGMMTGQLLGGSNPITAIQYQIMIMIAIFAGSSIAVVTAIQTANCFVFDSFSNPREDLIRPGVQSRSRVARSPAA